ncbi:MAG: hypothetical protein A2289_22780 [Deltaproteobacteria bacterium RIFOXYA12_FULL_58_15]|nr:MAG: hypothetical protein A2289_22780 [Deltaproteobacteria bacterium RIFOXYA12_FULL_58_15]
MDLGLLSGNEINQEQLAKYWDKQKGDAEKVQKLGIKSQDMVVKGGSEKLSGEAQNQPRVKGKQQQLAPPEEKLQSEGKKRWFDCKDVEGKIHVVNSKGEKLMESMHYEDTKLSDEKLTKLNGKLEKDPVEAETYAKNHGWVKKGEEWQQRGFKSMMQDWEETDPGKAQAFADANGMRKVGDDWQMSVEANSANFTSIGGVSAAETPSNASVISALSKNKALMSMMGDADAAAFMNAGTGDLSSLLGGGGMYGVLANGGGGLTAGLMVGGMLGSGMAAAAADGMAFHMKTQMRRMAYKAQDNAMRAMINNPGIPIEDLIFMFMSYMTDRYDQKLRDKMEESVRAETRENERERLKEKGNFLGGLVAASGSGLVGMLNPGLAMGAQMGGQAIRTYYDGKIAMQDAVGGYTKSSTQLANEVQMLMNKWKQMNEMMSNLMKAMSDMAMTTIRNIR